MCARAIYITVYASIVIPPYARRMANNKTRANFCGKKNQDQSQIMALWFAFYLRFFPTRIARQRHTLRLEFYVFTLFPFSPVRLVPFSRYHSVLIGIFKCYLTQIICSGELVSWPAMPRTRTRTGTQATKTAARTTIAGPTLR